MSAHSRYFPLLVATALMSASGCICVTGGGGGGGSRGNVTMLWSFAGGRQCFEVPDVSRIVITIPGQTLENNGVFGCTNAGTAGITLLDFRAATYSYTIVGESVTGTQLYRATGSFTVDGDVTVNAQLEPVGGATGSVYVSATLPAGTPVTCQYLQAVDIAIDNGAAQAFPCTTVTSTPGALVQGLTVGTHTIDISARDANGLFYYRALNQFTVFAGGASSQQFTLEWIVGSAPVRWAFSNGVTQLNCAQAGVGTVRITLRNASGDTVVDANCLNQGVQGYQVPYVYYGDYQIFLSATGTGGVPYYSSSTAPPTYTVQAGVFPPVDTSTPQILMTP